MRKRDRPDGLVWQDNTPSVDYPYQDQEQPDIQGLHYMAKGKGGSVEIEGDTLYVSVGKSYGRFENSIGGVNAAKQVLSRFRDL